MAKTEQPDPVESWSSNFSNLGFDVIEADGRQYKVKVRRRRTIKATGEVQIETNERIVPVEQWASFTRGYTKRTS